MTNASIAFLLAVQPEAATSGKVNIWIPVVAALLASFLTGLVGLLLSWQRQSFDRRAEHLRFMRSKLEETHEVGRSILTAYNQMHSRMSIVIATQGNPQIVEVINNEATATVSEGGTPKLRMLVEFYCPKLLPKLELIEEAIKRQGAHFAQCSNTAFKGHGFPRSLLDQQVAANDGIRKAINDFHSALSGVARGLVD